MPSVYSFLVIQRIDLIAPRSNLMQDLPATAGAATRPLVSAGFFAAGVMFYFVATRACYWSMHLVAYAPAR